MSESVITCMSYIMLSIIRRGTFKILLNSLGKKTTFKLTWWISALFFCFFSFVSSPCSCRLKAGISTKKKFHPKSSSKKELDKFYDMVLDRLSKYQNLEI